LTDGQLLIGGGAAGQLRHGATHGAAGGPSTLSNPSAAGATGPTGPVFSYREDFSGGGQIPRAQFGGTFYESAQYASQIWGDGGYCAKVGFAWVGHGSNLYDYSGDAGPYLQSAPGSLSLRRSFSDAFGIPLAPDFHVPADAAVVTGTPNDWVSLHAAIDFSPAEVAPATKGTAICGVKALTGDGTYPGARVALSIVDEDGLVVATLDATNLPGPNLIDDTTIPFFLQIDIDTMAPGTAGAIASVSVSRTEGGPPLSPAWPTVYDVPEARGKLVRPQWTIDGLVQGPAVNEPSLYALPVSSTVDIRVPVQMEQWNVAGQQVQLTSARVLGGYLPAVGSQVTYDEVIAGLDATVTDTIHPDYFLSIRSPCAGTVTQVASTGDTVGPGDSVMTIAYASSTMWPGAPGPWGEQGPPRSPQGVELSLLAWRNGLDLTDGSLAAGPGASGSLRVG
jgi:hypothetical protein